MSEERKVDVFSALILIFSIIAIILEIIGPFAYFYLGGGNYRYSCLDCEYSTGVDYMMQILAIILLVIQIIIALNELIPNKFIKMEVTKYGIILAILTMVFALIGIASFGISYAFYEWWPDLGFYGLAIGGLINTILFFLKQKNM